MSPHLYTDGCECFDCFEKLVTIEQNVLLGYREGRVRPFMGEYVGARMSFRRFPSRAPWFDAVKLKARV
jgi:hypothetical protein